MNKSCIKKIFCIRDAWRLKIKMNSSLNAWQSLRMWFILNNILHFFSPWISFMIYIDYLKFWVIFYITFHFNFKFEPSPSVAQILYSMFSQAWVQLWFPIFLWAEQSLESLKWKGRASSRLKQLIILCLIPPWILKMCGMVFF